MKWKIKTNGVIEIIRHVNTADDTRIWLSCNRPIESIAGVKWDDIPECIGTNCSADHPRKFGRWDLNAPRYELAIRPDIVIEDFEWESII